jgi:hypothetical protein
MKCPVPTRDVKGLRVQKFHMRLMFERKYQDGTRQAGLKIADIPAKMQVWTPHPDCLEYLRSPALTPN